MKKWINILSIGLVSILMLTACVSKEESVLNKDEGLKIVSTVFSGYDFAKQIVGDNANVSMLLPTGADSHTYEPSPQDIIKIQNADLFIYVGGESEKWIDKIIDSMDNNVMKIKMIDLVQLQEPDIFEEMCDHEHHTDCDHEHHTDCDHDHDTDCDHDHSHEYDEHVWTSLRNSSAITKSISKAIILLDEKNKLIYEENTNNYIEKLNYLDEKFKELFKKTKEPTLIFGDRFPFRYFANDYDLDFFAAFPGCSSDTEPSVSTITFLIDKVKEKSITTVFHIEFSNHKIADTIAEATGTKIAMLHSCHNISKEEMNNGVSYYSLMEQNYETLKEALE